MIRNYIIAIAAWCLAALLCYLPWRLLYLKRKGKPVSVLREVCLALAHLHLRRSKRKRLLH